MQFALAVASVAADEPTFANVVYGDHPNNVLDFWQGRGDGPRPLVVFIHGGGWFSGDRKVRPSAFKPYLGAGISYASIDYRLTPDWPLPAPLEDAARAVQFLRSKSRDWRIDPDRIAAIGISAGGTSAMWLLLHDDFADPTSDDPIERESTRLTAALAMDAQTSLDPVNIGRWIGPEVSRHPMLYRAIGLHAYDASFEGSHFYRPVFLRYSPIAYLDAADPPLMLFYSRNLAWPAANDDEAIHHPEFGRRLKSRSDAIGHECVLQVGPGRGKVYAGGKEFLAAKLFPERNVTQTTQSSANPLTRHPNSVQRQQNVWH